MLDWERQHSIYRTFQAESEVAISKYKAGYITRQQLTQTLAACDKRLADALDALKGGK